MSTSPALVPAERSPAATERATTMGAAPAHRSPKNARTSGPAHTARPAAAGSVSRDVKRRAVSHPRPSAWRSELRRDNAGKRTRLVTHTITVIAASGSFDATWYRPSEAAPSHRPTTTRSA